MTLWLAGVVVVLALEIVFLVWAIIHFVEDQK